MLCLQMMGSTNTEEESFAQLDYFLSTHLSLDNCADHRYQTQQHTDRIHPSEFALLGSTRDLALAAEHSPCLVSPAAV